MTLQIRVELPRIQLTVLPPRMDVELEYPQVRIAQEQPRVYIDQTAPLGEIGLQRSLALARTYSQKAMVNAAEAIAAYAQEGNMYLEVHKGVTVGQVVRAITQEDIPELNIAALPATRPKIEAEGNLEIDFKVGGVQIDAHLGEVRVDVHGGQVDIAVEGHGRPRSTVDLRI